MNKKKKPQRKTTTLRKKIAYLEFVNEQLKKELSSLHEILLEAGFTEGIKSVKQAAKEWIDEQESQ